MKQGFVRRTLRGMAMAACAAGLGACTTVLLPPNITPVVAPSTSVAEATARIEKVKVDRAAIEAEFSASERVCYAKFFVNSCLDEAKEKRRGALAYQRAIEVEAEHFRRQANVEQRDRDVALAVKEFEEGEARAAAAPPEAPKAAPVRKPVAPRASLAERKAAHDAKLARTAAREQADAPKRAANAQAFEQRKLESAQRQLKVAKKKAEKAEKAARAADPSK
ncbi:hypothetical protein [Massilia sp. CF038]|uniref:hypothetical protein n=1 Tax=Massilia sp. CF038 TaxID=1881045 RepID=UPI00091829C5|nr:hypothetical protein [Massilia sp. CF038]SHG53119.1 hypothetical protein SAMN05428948_0895 [Massilia sp. CF038]